MKSGKWIIVFLGAGAALEMLALLLSLISGGSTLLGLLVLLGILAGLFSLSQVLSAKDKRDGQVVAPLWLISLGMSGIFLLASVAMDSSWDSLIFFCRIMMVVSLAVAVLHILPSLARRVALSFLLLFHFLGIVTAVTSLDPPNASASWIATTLWANVFRHYLNFCYLNNAYHFYSPEPGPPSLLWSKIQYKDGTFRWVKIPNRNESPIQMHYQRMLSVTESSNMNNTGNPENWDEILQRRNLAGLAHQPQITPLPRNISQLIMYREPVEYSKRMVSSYARYLALQYAHPPGQKEIGLDRIKIYRITHGIISVQDLADGHDPLDNTLFMPYFLGEFDSEGKLVNPNDPFLYFLLPITRTMNPNEPTVTVNSLEIHAGEIKRDPHLKSEGPK